MGFFSSRKYDVANDGSEQTTVHVVRSRFYGKVKEKARQPQTFSLPRDRDRPSFDRPGRLPSNNVNDIPRHPRSTASTRSSSDAVTMTLAQRLSELAVANEQGLLDDDEYRLLRQNLFERFTTGSPVPTEAPIVRLSGLGRSPADHISSVHNSARPESVRSKTSITTTVSGLFRRATSRRSASNPSGPSSSDSISVISVGSSVRPQSRTFPLRSVGRQSSRVSLQSEASQTQEALSPQETDATIHRSMTPNSRIQGYNAPPSAFSTRGIRGTAKDSQSLETMNGNHTQSVKEIRQEIEAVEAEGRRLLDAFNGLELSTLTRSQRRPPGTIPMSTSSIRADSDTMSINSGGSASMSIKPSPSGRIAGNSSPLISQPISLSRKNSVSSMSSRGKSVMSSPLGRLGTGSTSSVNLNRNPAYSSLATVDEKTVPLGSSSLSTNDATIQTIESEMADIRRRRAEVVARYEARLEFLRVKLKGAEMHEKLLKR